MTGVQTCALPIFTRNRQSWSFAVFASIAVKILLSVATTPRSKKSASPSLFTMVHTPGAGLSNDPLPQLKCWTQEKPAPHPVIVIGQDGKIATGDVLDIPRGTVHQMWNASTETAVLSWKTMPAGRTLDWFCEMAALARGEDRDDPAKLLESYSDVFRLGPSV